MVQTLPRIESVSASGPTALSLRFKDGAEARVELAGWIATGGDVLAPLADPATFAQAEVADWGAAVGWPAGDDLAIDAYHLSILAEEQRPFDAAAVAAWQADVSLSNNEAADFLGVALSTWNLYRAGGAVPNSVAMACRAARRDPVLLQAHYRPRKAGRPRKQAAEA